MQTLRMAFIRWLHALVDMKPSSAAKLSVGRCFSHGNALIPVSSMSFPQGCTTLISQAAASWISYVEEQSAS